MCQPPDGACRSPEGAPPLLTTLVGLALLAFALAACSSSSVTVAPCGRSPSAAASADAATHPLLISTYFVGAPKSDGIVAVDATDGHVVWQQPIIGQPQALQGDIVYITGPGGKAVYALCAATGQMHWQVSNEQVTPPGNAQVLLIGELLITEQYVPTPSGIDRLDLVARRAQDGGEVWRRPKECDGMSTDGATLYFSACDCNSLMAVNPRDSSVLWTKVYPHPSMVCRSKGAALTVVNGVGYQSGGDSDNAVIRAVRLSDGTELWRSAWPEPYPARGYVEQELAVSHDVVYAFGPHSLSALRAQDGAILWTRPTSAQMGGVPPVMAGQAIVAGGEDGLTYGFNATTGQMLWQAQTQQDWLARMAT
jgi:outer membrane protein assembly factor BamB